MLYLTFHIDEPVVAAIKSWQQQVNDEIVGWELAQRGRARIGRLGEAFGEQEIDTLPAPGSAEPWYGPGGSYTFTFSPAPDSCRLTVSNPGDTRSESAVPLELELGHCLHVEEDPIQLEDAFRWRHPQYSGYNPAGGGQVGVEEIVFWIDGHLMRRLEEAGWTPGRAGEYDYSFRPNAMGADVSVAHRESDVIVELVRDAPGS